MRDCVSIYAFEDVLVERGPTMEEDLIVRGRSERERGSERESEYDSGRVCAHKVRIMCA